MSGNQPTIHSDGGQSRDFTFVENAVSANIKACFAPDAPGKVFNIGCGSRIDLNALYARLTELLNVSMEPAYSPARIGDVRHSLADITQARNILDYEPTTDVYEGLRQTVSYFRGNQ